MDNVRVRIEHSHFSLKDLAQVTIRDPQTLLVTVHDGDVSFVSNNNEEWHFNKPVNLVHVSCRQEYSRGRIKFESYYR